MCRVAAETAVGAASATLRKEDGASREWWAPRASTDPQGCKASRACKAKKARRASAADLGSSDPKAKWAAEALQAFQGPTGYPDTQDRAALEEDPALTAAMAPKEMQASRDCLAPGDSLAIPDPKDQKGRKASLTHYPPENVTATGANPVNQDWSASRVPLAARGSWGQWGQSELQGDRAHLDLLDPKGSRAIEDSASTE